MSRAGSLSKITHSTSTKKFKATLLNNQPIIQRNLPTFQAYLKQYPLDIGQDIMEIVKMIQPLQLDFSQNLKSLKMYKQQLGSIFQQNWCDFLAYLKNIIIKMNKRTNKLAAQKQSKIAQLLETIKNMELEKIQLQNKLDKLHNLRQLQNAQLLMANNQLDIVNRQMRSIYKILQSDMSQVMLFLTTLQQKKQKFDESISNEMNASLNNLSTLLDTVQKQQTQTGTTLATMKQMIKAMTKSVKVNTGTQVDQSQLQTNVGTIFTKGQVNIPVEVADGISVNVTSLNQVSNLLQKMKLKQKDLPHEQYIPKKSIDKPWALTPTLLVFLQNMSKQNQIGRVLPWDYVKQIITQIYDQRIKYQAQISTSIVGNSMGFDQFVIFFFITKFKIRRLAEVKLLQMIISLKYYSKFWTKAQTFCCLLDVMKFQPYSDPTESAIFKFDHYAQNYFFSIYKYIKRFTLFHDTDGTVYTQIQNLRKLVKIALFFTEDLSKSRIASRIQKNIRVIKQTQYCDLDLSLQLILDEYFAIKKRNNSWIAKSFSKAYQKNKGFFSISEITDIFDCLNPMYKKWEDSVQKYPIQSDLYIGKLYLNAITSGKNNNQMLANSFTSSAQKFGFDCPYPFIRSTFRKKSANEQSSQIIKSAQVSKVLQEKQIKSSEALKSQNISLIKQQMLQAKNDMKVSQNLNLVRIDAGSRLFSQHFSILKQLNDYVRIFGQTLSVEKNPDILWRSFNQIKMILQRGCQFLKYPLVKQKIV